MDAALLQELFGPAPGEELARERALQLRNQRRATGFDQPDVGANLERLGGMVPGSAVDREAQQGLLPGPMPQQPAQAAAGAAAAAQAGQGMPGAPAMQPAPPQGPAQPPAQPRALPKAAGAPVSNSTSATSKPETAPVDPNQPSASEELRQRREKLEGQLAEAEKEPDYSGLRGEAQARQTGSRNALIMALAAQQAGQGFEPFSAQYLKKSAELGSPMKVEGGYINEQGQAVIDPGYKRQQQLQQLQRRVQAYDTAIAQAQSKEEANALRAEQQKVTNQLAAFQAQTSRMMAGIAQGNLDLRRDIAGVGQGGGAIDALPKNASSEEKKTYAAATEGLRLLPGLIEGVRKNPDAFGFSHGVGEKVGGALGTGSWASNTPEGVALRGRVFQRYAAIINDMIGAAQSEGEVTRLRPFIPLPGEGAESIAQKMGGAMQEFGAQRGNLRNRYGLGADRPTGADQYYQ